MKNPRKMAQELKELKSKIERLERAERELTALNAPGEVFATELNSIRARLKLPGKVEEVEQEIKALRQRAEEYNRDLKSRRERLERAERELLALNTSEEVFATELTSIRAKLKLPGKVEEVEQEIKALRQRAEEYNRDLKSRRERLERAERELTALKAPEEVFASELGSLRAKLKLPDKVEEVEQEIKALRRRVEEYNRARALGILFPQSYSIVEKIGSGGFAEVFLARRKDDGMVVALKVPRLDPVTTFNPADFSREAELWSQLRHPHIVKVYEYGMRPGPWIAMEYLERGSLRQKMGRLRLKESLEIALKLTQALFYAHHGGVVHRDIKPENVLFDAQNAPKLTDWGLGKMTLEHSLSLSGFKGTPAYAAPEQFSRSEFGEADWRSDIYQLGVVIYEMVTGQLPFGGELGTKLFKEAVAPTAVNPQLPPQLDRIVLKAMAKRKEERYQDVSALEEQLQGALSQV